MDDGADVVGVLHRDRRDYLGDIIGGTEDDHRRHPPPGPRGAGRARVSDRGRQRGRLRHLFDNRYGTGQSTVDGIIRATNILLAGRKFVIAGYGWVGRGVAMRARGMGAHVIVTEVDPMRAPRH